MTQTADGNISFRQILAVLGLLGVIIATVLLSYQQRGFGVGRVVIDDRIEVQVRVAANSAAREQGLSGTAELAADQGMLFLFSEPAKYQFWMKDMLLPLDAVWLKDGKIVDLTLNIAPPVPGEQIPVFAPLYEADAVLEVSAGFAARHGLRLGLPVTYYIDKRGPLR